MIKDVMTSNPDLAVEAAYKAKEAELFDKEQMAIKREIIELKMNMEAANKISNIIMDLSLQQSASKETVAKNPVVVVP